MTLCERVETLATQAFGQGASVSLERRKVPCSDHGAEPCEQLVWSCSIWRPDGTVAMYAQCHPTSENTRQVVLAIMLGHLKDECARLNEVGS